MKIFARAIATMGLVIALTGLIASSAAAQEATLAEVADQIEATGRYIEAGVPVDAEISAAIDRANAEGIAFVRLDNASDAEQTAAELALELKSRNSAYPTVLVSTRGGVWSNGSGNFAQAGDEVTTTFQAGLLADGIDQFTNIMDGSAIAQPESTSSGGGFPWIIPIILLIGGFFLVNTIRGRSKTKKVEAKTIEDDRAEIIEQLKANADRVIDLGDEVIKVKDPELISIYEEASAAYQNVSNEIRNAKTAAEVDALDDQIDKAEWQFEVIEAKLTGQTPPPFVDGDVPPAPTSKDRIPTSSTASPADRDNELRRQGQDPRPLPQRNPRVPAQQTRRRSGLGGTLGRMALSVIMSMIMGGGLGRPRTSRRTQRRSGGGLGGMFGGSSGSSSGGGFGGVKNPF